MKYIKQNAWAMWIGAWIAFLGFGIFTWQFWTCLIPLIALVSLSHHSLNDEDRENSLKNIPEEPVKKDLDYFR